MKPNSPLTNDPIAIIGMGCRFPGGANDINLYWKLLCKEYNPVKPFPIDRHTTTSDHNLYSKKYMYGGYLDSIREFDADFFNITSKEANYLDPQQRLLLEVSWQALENAGIEINKFKGSRTGIFIGISTFDYAIQLLQDDSISINAFTGTGAYLSAAAGRLAYTYGTVGPALAIDTACSSSLVSLHLACQSLKLGECDIAIVGGVNAILSDVLHRVFINAGMLSPDGQCKTFDESANGYVRSEGCGVIVIKRLSDALKNKDFIHSIIYGSAVNQDGRSGGLTMPSGKAQTAVITQALSNANIKPSEVGYLETHGTGTPLGDPIEIIAASEILMQGRSKEKPLIIGSVKSNIGHLEAASGIAGLIKVVQTIKHGKIPSNLHLNNPNPHVPWNDLAIIPSTKLMDWPEEISTYGRIAGVSAFGITGTNAHVILGAAPKSQQMAPKIQTYHFQRNTYWHTEKEHKAGFHLQNLYRIEWSPKITENLTNQIDKTVGGIWIVISRNNSYTSYIKETILDQGNNCHVLCIGECNDSSVIKDEVDTLLHSLNKNNERSIKGVIYLPTQHSSYHVEMITEEILFELNVIIELTKHIHSINNNNLYKLWFITNNVFQIDPLEKDFSLHHSAIYGLCKAISCEYPDVFGGMIDLDITHGHDTKEISQCIDLISLNSINCPVAVRNNILYNPYLIRIDKNELSNEFILSDNALYIITGGMGAIGLEITKWMAKKGAKHIMLIGRNEPSSNAKSVINILKNEGVNVIVSKADVSNISELSSVIKKAQHYYPPIRGIIHAAGIVDDILLKDTSLEKIKSVLLPKAVGAWHLHLSTLDIQMDFFVMFSSIASVFGSPGQGNYSAANAFLDELVLVRRSMGLPAQSINWGPWNIGMTSVMSDSAKTIMKSKAIAPMDVNQNLLLLEKIISENMNQYLILDVDWDIFSKSISTMSPLLSNIIGKQTETIGPDIGKSIHKMLSNLPIKNRRDFLLKKIKYLFSKTLELKNANSIKSDINFTDMGVNSIIIHELVYNLEKLFDMKLSTTLLFNFPTIDKLTTYFQSELNMNIGSDTATEKKDTISPDHKVNILSENELQSIINEKFANLIKE